MRKKMITASIMVFALAAISVEAAKTNLIVSVRADGLLYYYNPFNGQTGYVNNDGVVTDDGAAAGSTIAMCAHGEKIYTLGQVQTGPNSGQYRVNMIDFTGVDTTASGNSILASVPANRNVISNTAAATLIDLVYDGTDFWFLADDGQVFSNSTATAAFDFGATIAGVYGSLSLRENNKLIAGLLESGTWYTKVLQYDSGTIGTLSSFNGGGNSNGVARVAGTPGTSMTHIVRGDNLAYTTPPSTYWGNFNLGGGAPTKGLTQGSDGTTDSAYVLLSTGTLTFNTPGNTLTLSNGGLAVDIAAVDVTAVTAQPFPAIPDLLGANLIPNGELTSLTNKNPAGTGTWNVNGSFGDYGPIANRTADLVDWSFYYADPNNLIPAVGTPHLVDGNGELDGTFYIDTHITGNFMNLNSVMDYRNGMKQEDILNGVTIDSGKTYRLVVDAEGWDRPTATFRVALTDGTGTAVTNTANAIAGGLLSNPLPDWDGAQYSDISGADLLAAGQLNVIFDSVNPAAIPGFPGSVAPGDVNNVALVAQIKINSVTLAEVLTAGFGDVNKDGVVDLGDLDLANDTLDGSVDGGDDAATRQDALISGGMTSAEVLAFLNLTSFDLNGDDYFDAADIAVLDALLVPVLQMTVNGGTLDFAWNSKGVERQYDLLATSDLTLGSWAPYNDGATTYENIPGIAGFNTLTGVLTSGPEMFFKVLEEASSITYLEVSDGSFEDPAGTGNWRACPASWNATGSGIYQTLIDPGHMGASADGIWSAHMRNMGTIHQELGTVNAGDTLTVTFSGGNATSGASTTGGGVFNCSIIVGGDFNTVAADTTGLSPGTWQSFTNTWTATDSGTLRLEFSNVSGNTAWIDNISDVKREQP